MYRLYDQTHLIGEFNSMPELYNLILDYIQPELSESKLDIVITSLLFSENKISLTYSASYLGYLYSIGNRFYNYQQV